MLGHILMFFVLAMVLMLSLLAFNDAKDRAAERAARSQADAIAQQVAGSVAEAALFVEHEGATARYERLLSLAQQLEGREYQIHLEPKIVDLLVPANDRPDRIRVAVDGFAVEATAPALHVSASGVVLLDSSASGGKVAIRYDTCPSPPPAQCLFIEARP